MVSNLISGGVTVKFDLLSHQWVTTTAPISIERSIQMDLAVFNQAHGHLLNPDSQYVERKYLMW